MFVSYLCHILHNTFKKIIVRQFNSHFMLILQKKVLID